MWYPYAQVILGCSMTWSMAWRLVHRHAYLSIRLALAVLSLFMMWACVGLALAHQPVVAYQAYHPGLYHHFFEAYLVLHVIFAKSALLAWVKGHHLLVILAAVSVYLPIHLYCVIELVRSQFDGFTIDISIE